LSTTANCLAPSSNQRLKLFFALSRTPHGLIDMTTPILGALLWLGAFPAPAIMVVGVITAIAGYTAVYALNDLVDYRHDRRKARAGAFDESGCDLDAVLVRHPLAQGYLRYSEAVIWTAAWALVALLGAWWLNPVCVFIFLGGALLEVLYCLLWNVSPYRTVVSGVVKTAGAMAAVFAVDPSPSPWFLLALFCLLFAWEVGGQNVPNDWSDLDDDRHWKAQTIPVVWGKGVAKIIILGALFTAIFFSRVTLGLSLGQFGAGYLVLAVAVGIYLLIVPAVRLFIDESAQSAMRLFNRASYYPMALLVVVVVRIVVGT
jgi:4-hydroxybenzoate polyprenyltransferase